ncbi:inactive pancreatic lipase-related protein 1-like [Physella acuta]|uniref:inactive pancreatic lipase-related protein 1-like n=1 Tax=Physella acuta TaxID=109671 RepID=UPI0027DDD780|nr:inactive pancreatic lipase-related protein 1-like [Physella acuta]
MGRVLISLALTALCLGTTYAYNETQVCYEVIGCFNNSFPFNNTNGVLPKSPQELGVRIWMFTRQNPEQADVLDYADNTTFNGSNFDTDRPTKFIVHGFSSSFEKTAWIFQMRDKLLIKGDFNVIAVDWSKGATLPDYFQATANIRVVAAEIKLILDMMEDMGYDLSKVHFIGHSLGAHLSGFVGHMLGPNRLGRISGMDPAEPNFLNYTLPVRLDSDDAIFVDVIHTDGSKFSLIEGFGLMQESGDVDFYVNGGEKQPGCTDALSSILHINGSLEGSLSCSHGRAHDIYLESFDSTCNFTAYPCDSLEKFENGECFQCSAGQGCSVLGIDADLYPARGDLYIDTHHTAPFCGVPYHVKVFASPDAPETTGLIYVSLNGSGGSTDFIPINTRNKKINALSEISTNIVYRSDVGTVTSVDVRYEKDVGFLGGLLGSSGTNTFSITGIEVMSPSTETWTSSCRGSYQLVDKTPVHLETTLGRTSDPCTVVG